MIGIAAHLDEAALRLCREALVDEKVLWVADDAGPRWHDELGQCEVVFGTVPAEWIPRLAALRWLQLESIGFDGYREIAASMTDRGIAVTNLRGQFAHPVAETVLAGILGLVRGIDRLVLAGVERRWESLAVRPQTGLLTGSSVLVLGAGSIGGRIRELLESFGCHVRSFARASAAAELHSLAELDAALPTADIVVSCLPGTPETRLIFDRVRLSRLAQGSLFVNVGRGDAVDEAALGDALTTGRLGGAVLDVTSREPLDVSDPLWMLPRTLLTQHTGGGYRDELSDKADRFLDNLARWRSGEPLEHLVDLRAGY